MLEDYEIEIWTRWYMTTQEAAERWNVTAESLKQNCRGRVKYGFLEGEFRKSKKIWLVTRQGMERLYGKERLK